MHNLRTVPEQIKRKTTIWRENEYDLIKWKELQTV